MFLTSNSVVTEAMPHSHAPIGCNQQSAQTREPANRITVSFDNDSPDERFGWNFSPSVEGGRPLAQSLSCTR